MNDIFISYAHVDNESLTEGQKGWISQFHRTLEIRLRQLLGENPRIWRDMKLSGTDIFDEKIVNAFANTRLMISIVSPRYVNSEWCNRELNEFYSKAEDSGGIRVGEKSRIIKVVKTPVEGEANAGSVHEIFNSLLGFEFFDTDPDSGRVREFNEEFGHEAKRNYLERVYDLAHEITGILKEMSGGQASQTPLTNDAGRVVYLADVTSDLKGERDRIRRELQERGHTVLPDRPLPLEADEAQELVSDFLSKSHLAIHLIGNRYGIVPEGGDLSLIDHAYTVTDADTALSSRSGHVAVLGTPRLVALLEEATMAALDGALADGETSVGMRLHVDHLAPVAPGTGVTAEAVLEGVEGRRLTFSATATVGDVQVARASIVRVVVETDRFLDRVDGGTA